MKKVKIILIGAGHRGSKIYGKYVLENAHKAEIIAVAEINKDRRNSFGDEHNIPDNMRFEIWEQAIEKSIEADAVIIATQDNEHYEPVIAFLKHGYHVLCEKPMSSDPYECLNMQKVAEENGKMLVISHVLRYTPFYSTVKDILDRGEIGRIMSIQYNENVGIDHFVHSYVRGNWRNLKISAPMILAKSCHDTDIITWITGKKCKKVYSAGELSFFKSENAPDGATEKCTQGCPVEDKCEFSALKAYIHRGNKVDLSTQDEWVKSISFVIGAGEDTSLEGRLDALRKGNYGKCAFKCDNDVVDHQVATFVLEDDITVVFTMCGFTKNGGRTFKIMGTQGELHCNMAKNEIRVASFDGSEKLYYPSNNAGGHGGGDNGLVKSFIKFLTFEDSKNVLTSGRDSVHSHIIAFAAEESRRTGKVIDIEEYERELLDKKKI